VWYNATNNVLKFQYTNTLDSWSTGGNLNTARVFLAGAGTQTSALAFGGTTPPAKNETESYNGTNWTEVNNLNTARFALAGAGADNTSALAFGGRPPSAPVGAETESWNGSNWTEVNDLNTARSTLAGA
jgi:hypothetical protein